MASSTVEDYLKRINLEGGSAGGALVPMGRLARVMEVVPGTVTAMVKSLVGSRLVHYEPYAGVRLTRSGERLALRIVRRHRVIELFLVETLGVDWSEVHEEAERLEHAVSDRLVQKMDEFLGRPGFDPHGDPIPKADGSVPSRELARLADQDKGARCRIARIDDQSTAFLRAVEQLGLTPGAAVRVLRRDDAAGTIELKLRAGRSVTVAEVVARRLLVESV